MNQFSPFWQAVHNAYETHDVAEARRLLHSVQEVPDCSLLLRCNDEDYIRWLLNNELLPMHADDNKYDWPGLQELQLQCSALNEPAQPDCILNGRLPHSENEK